MTTSPFRMLSSMNQIADTFRVNKRRVKEWYLQGAPIIQITECSYRADADRLYDWLLEKQRRENKNGAQRCQVEF